MTQQENSCGFSDKDLETAFGFLTREERLGLCPYLQIKVCPAKMVLMEENDASDYLGFLAEGRLAVKKETDFKGKYIILAILEKGTVVGETEILGHGPRSSTVVAVEESRLLTLTDESFDLLLNEEPPLGIKLLKRIVYIMSLRLRKAGERLSQLL
jgi:CRP/FNR family cyclic AMP-dependent transcriptional regulator